MNIMNKNISGGVYNFSINEKRKEIEISDPIPSFNYNDILNIIANANPIFNKNNIIIDYKVHTFNHLELIIYDDKNKINEILYVKGFIDIKENDTIITYMYDNIEPIYYRLKINQSFIENNSLIIKHKMLKYFNLNEFFSQYSLNNLFDFFEINNDSKKYFNYLIDKNSNDNIEFKYLTEYGKNGIAIIIEFNLDYINKCLTFQFLNDSTKYAINFNNKSNIILGN